jgi:benzil reductase ((S)-benzoin forming)
LHKDEAMHLYVVTGASRGLGWALVQACLARPDSQVLAISRSGVPECSPALQDLHCDLAEAAGQQQAAAAIGAALSGRRWRKAVLLNNAGTIEPIAPADSADAQAIGRAMALNLVAPMVLTQAFLAHQGQADAASIVNISSGAGRRPLAGWSAYCASKAGLDMATRVAALEAEQSGSGVRITALAPGIIDTAMQAVIRSASEADFPEVGHFRGLKEQGALQSADEVAARIIALEAAGRLPAGLADLREL